ncbi:MAG: hypothetical protein NWR72_12485 [Bacteroidia bacterium]|nr:hypothetical protein [Bacteroidia bacterium]
MSKRLAYFDVVQIDEAVSRKAIEFVESFKLSHGLTIPDAMIGATAAVDQLSLYTYNVRDFDFLPNIVLYQPATLRLSLLFF